MPGSSHLSGKTVDASVLSGDASTVVPMDDGTIKIAARVNAVTLASNFFFFKVSLSFLK